MDDPYNPTLEEIEDWAFDSEADEPVQDWDIFLRSHRHEKLYLDLASNDGCPKRRYFLHLLYFIVGDAAKDGFQSPPRPVVEGFVERAQYAHHPDLKLWYERSRALIADPSSYEHQLWCGGGLAGFRFAEFP